MSSIFPYSLRYESKGSSVGLLSVRVKANSGVTMKRYHPSSYDDN